MFYMKNKKKSGSALGLVLITLIVVVLLGTAILLSSMQGALLNAGMTAANKHFYAAESGAQVGMQMLLDAIDDDVNGFYQSGVKTYKVIKVMGEPTQSDIDNIASQLSSLLNAFRTDELSLDTVNEEVEIVRQQMYDRKRIKN